MDSVSKGYSKRRQCQVTDGYRLSIKIISVPIGSSHFARPNPETRSTSKPKGSRFSQKQRAFPFRLYFTSSDACPVTGTILEVEDAQNMKSDQQYQISPT